jgi:hypothetical protein
VDVLDELAAGVVIAQGGRVDGVDHPHLVAGAAGGDIDPPQVTSAGCCRSIVVGHDGHEHDVAFVALELVRVADAQIPAGELTFAQVLHQGVLDEPRLAGAQQGHDPDRHPGIGGVGAAGYDPFDEGLSLGGVRVSEPGLRAAAVGDADRT